MKLLQTLPAVSLIAVQPDDFEALVKIRIEAMRESLENIGRFDPERARERFRTTFAPEHTRHILTAEKYAGFVALRPVENLLQLEHLYIRPGFQGQGVGTAVLAQIFQEADAMAFPIRVGALRESAANRFYIRCGFQLVECSEFDNYYLRTCPQ